MLPGTLEQGGGDLKRGLDMLKRYVRLTSAGCALHSYSRLRFLQATLGQPGSTFQRYHFSLRFCFYHVACVRGIDGTWSDNTYRTSILIGPRKPRVH